MLDLRKRYRRNYIGEPIVVQRTYTKGRWQDVTETVPNVITNSQISNQAVVLGNGPSRLEFDLRHIKNHRGGLLGSRRLQSYGCNALYRDFAPDFLVTTGVDMVNELAYSSYVNDHIVYTNSVDLKNNPGKFYLIPHNPYTDAGTTALYLAAFDGHQKVFMLGFDGQDSENYNYNVYAGTPGYQSKQTTINDSKWIKDRKTLFDTYNDTEFIRVTKKNTEPIPESWRYCINFRTIDQNQFVIEADL